MFYLCPSERLKDTVMELPLHRHGSHGFQEPGFHWSAAHTLPGTAMPGRPRTAATTCGPPAWRGFGADCHILAMLQGFFFCLLTLVATDQLTSHSSLSHSPTSPCLLQLPSFFIFLPAWVRGPPTPWHSHHLAFFLPLDRPHPTLTQTHTHFQRSTHLRLSLNSFPQ